MQHRVAVDGFGRIGRNVVRWVPVRGQGPPRSILRFSDKPLVSRDVVGDPATCVVDSGLTQVHDQGLGWYDHERGYPNRLVDLTELLAQPEGDEL